MQQARQRRPGGTVPGEVESAEVKERRRFGAPPPQGEELRASDQAEAARLPGPLRAGLGAAVVLCVATAVVRVLLVFLQVAPPNSVSQRYSKQINVWVYPLFEQNWRLFAPDPESVNRQILARTAHTAPDGTVEVSPWFDLTPVDDAAVKHNPFPSHTAQNMLRRAWSSYVDSHGTDDEPHSDRAVMTRRYLCNIAVQRFADHQPGAIESIQLRVVTRPVVPPGTTGDTRPDDDRTGARRHPLPAWWKVTSHAR